MKNIPGRNILFLMGVSAVLSIAFFSACAGGKTVPAESGMPDGDAVISRVVQDFESKGDFKGISRFSRSAAGPVQSGRAAFAASPPDKMRIELLSPFGQPIVSLASNGAHIFLYDRSNDKLRSGVPSRSMIEKALGVPASVEELIFMLAGFAPVVDHHHTTVKRWRLAKNGPDRGFEIQLKTRFGRIKEKIWIDRDGKTVRKAALYDAGGEPLYTVLTEPGPRGPQMRILGKNGLTITLDPQRFWAKAGVDESRFTIKKPGG